MKNQVSPICKEGHGLSTYTNIIPDASAKESITGLFGAGAIFIKLSIVLLFCLFFLQSASAINWIFSKEQTCNFLNTNGTMKDCDIAWCNIIECPYNETLSACMCEKTTTTTNTTNYNLSEIEIIVRNISLQLINNFTAEFFETSSEYSDNNTKMLRDSFLDRLENETRANIQYSAQANTSNNSSDNTFFIILVVIASIGVTIFAMQYINNRKIPIDSRTNVPKIQRRIIQERREIPKKEIKKQPIETSQKEINADEVKDVFEETNREEMEE